MIHIAIKVYNSDRQLSIVQSLNATTTAATEVQNTSVSELHVVKAGHCKKGLATEDRSPDHPDQSRCKSYYCCGAMPSHAKKDHQAKDAKCYKCGRMDTPRVAASPRREKRTWEN